MVPGGTTHGVHGKIRSGMGRGGVAARVVPTRMRLLVSCRLQKGRMVLLCFILQVCFLRLQTLSRVPAHSFLQTFINIHFSSRSGCILLGTLLYFFRGLSSSIQCTFVLIGGCIGLFSDTLTCHYWSTVVVVGVAHPFHTVLASSTQVG